MKTNKYLCFIFIFSLYGCSFGGTIPSNHFPQYNLTVDEVSKFLIGYCWQMPNGRASKNNPDNKEVSVVVGEISGQQKIIIRDSYNLPPSHFSDFYIYKSGCVQYGNKIRYIANAVSINPKSKVISFTSGSDVNLTDFEFFQLNLENSTYAEEPILNPEQHSDYFVEPKRVFWSPDGSKIATLGMDVGGGGTNIWVYDVNTASIVNSTKFTTVGEWVASAAWSKNGEKLAVGLGEMSGVRIIDFSRGITLPDYVEVSHETTSDIGEWLYIYKNLLQLALQNENIRFTRYIYTSSSPVWVNDNQIIFTAVNQDGLSSLYMVDDTGVNLKRLIEKLSGNLLMPTLSPDGNTLAFVRYFSWKEKNKAEIGLVDLSNLAVSSLVVVESINKEAPLLLSGIAWSPDGNYLAFSSNHDGESDVYIVSSDGQYWLNTTKDIDGNAVSPFWIPK